MDSKTAPKVVQKMIEKMTPKITKNGPVLGHRMDPKTDQVGEGTVFRFQDAGFQKALGPKKPPECLKMAPRRPR